jgi:hypothetical protein
MFNTACILHNLTPNNSAVDGVQQVKLSTFGAALTTIERNNATPTATASTASTSTATKSHRAVLPTIYSASNSVFNSATDVLAAVESEPLQSGSVPVTSSSCSRGTVTSYRIGNGPHLDDDDLDKLEVSLAEL